MIYLLSISVLIVLLFLVVSVRTRIIEDGEKAKIEKEKEIIKESLIEFAAEPSNNIVVESNKMLGYPGVELTHLEADCVPNKTFVSDGEFVDPASEEVCPRCRMNYDKGLIVS